MKSTLKHTYEEAQNILVLAETKRIAENLTKMEMCQILGLNNNYYINCISGGVTPSQSIIESLESYLNMETSEVYSKVFAFRSSEKYVAKKSSARFMVINNMIKEKYHESWNMDENGFINCLRKLENDGRLTMPTA